MSEIFIPCDEEEELLCLFIIFWRGLSVGALVALVLLLLLFSRTRNNEDDCAKQVSTAKSHASHK